MPKSIIARFVAESFYEILSNLWVPMTTEQLRFELDRDPHPQLGRMRDRSLVKSDGTYWRRTELGDAFLRVGTLERELRPR